MKRHVIAAIVMLTAPATAEPVALDRAVLAFRTAHLRVQRAVMRDVCLDSDVMSLSRRGRSRLRRADHKSYDFILSRLGDLYDQVAEPTDGNLEAATGEFCNAID
jgi:hypothetical protein